MARILGNLVPEDEYTHPLGPEPNFNESMYFNFFDGERRVGGFVRIGNRANEGRAETTVCLYLPDGRVLFQFARAAIEDNAAFDAGGLRFEVLEPAERLRTRYQGSVVALAEPRAMADPRRAFRESPRLEVALDLVHEAVGPLFGRKDERAEGERPAEEQFGKAHYEQHVRATGHLEIARERQPIEGYGLRDHSWGPRHWQAIHRYEWLTANFGADLGAMVSVIQRDAAGRERTAGGVIVRGDALERIREARIEIDYEPNGLYHRALCADLVTEGGARHRLEGEVLSFIPLRNRRAGHTTHIGEGMTRWRLDGRTGHGLSELLRQVDPAEAR